MAKWHSFIHRYAWFILKNILGWILLLSSFIIGPAIPGPGGIPLFLIGFALITFPGKRRLTARVIRGKLVPSAGMRYLVTSLAVSLLLPALVIFMFGGRSRVEGWIYRHDWQPPVARLVAYGLSAIVLFAILSLTPLAINAFLRIMPRVRRKVRPSLRRMGIHLLPPRWLRHNEGQLAGRIHRAEEEIILFSSVWRENMSKAWRRLRPWLPKIIGIIVVPIIFYRLLKPIMLQWDSIRPQMEAIRWDYFAVACVMFAFDRFCRVLFWRGILRGLGWRMPAGPGARIWVSSELARYVPGVVWQVVGRAFMAKSYGLPITTCSISQVLEMTLYLLANVIVAVGTLTLFSSEIANEKTRLALRLAMLLIPILLAFLHPKVFRPVINFILAKLRRPLIEKQLSGRRLFAFLLLAIIDQFWLALGIWVATHSVLDVPIRDTWLLAGAYCLAWSAGFCMASIAPSGVGIREVVLSGTLALLLSSRTGIELDSAGRAAIFAAIALLLRLWATSGELLFALVAHFWDHKGARGIITQRAEPVGGDPDLAPLPRQEAAE